METETQLRVINSQFLYDEEAEIMSETRHTVTVKHGTTVEKFHKHNGLQFGHSMRERLNCEPYRLVGYNATNDSYEEPGTGQTTLFDQLKHDQLETALSKAIDEVGANNKQKEWFTEYHKANLNVFEKFCELTMQSIEKGLTTYGAMGIIQLMRWHTKTKADGDRFKINNNASPFYARMFEHVYPEHAGFFRRRKSSAD